MERPSPESSDRMELWGGVECTVNRVGSRYFDQLELSGHTWRISDIDRIASLGIRTVRYPILWERTAPSSPQQAEWRWSDQRMECLARKGVTPIVGLVHHGSGPRHTSLLDEKFPEKLADYADAVAERYPGIQLVTPINEPLTTARFSALYGYWYPHRRSWLDFVRALVNQCIATRAAMRAMQARIPGIKLVQTEDLGRIHSTPRLAYQARFENERRWLTFDLLSGRVDEGHPMWRHLALNPLVRAQLLSLVADPCAPDILGINYYVTSDRFLDDRIDLYPDQSAGGNGRDRYVDVEAVRAIDEGIAGHRAILSEAWRRYDIPLAVTEVHLGCTREQQLRWLTEAWQGACEAREDGCDVRAVTAWALFGSFGWDTLVTREPFQYECGAFDVRSNPPRETALARVIRDLASECDCDHPAIESEGWWRNDARLSVPAFRLSARVPASARASDTVRTVRPIIIAGARGTLGKAFVRICEERGLQVHAMGRDEMDVTDPNSVRRAIADLNPWAMVNAAGYVRVDEAEAQRASCYRTNTFAVGVLATECASAGIHFVTYSSDLVFDGRKSSPYVESDRVSPLGAYGASKAAAEMGAMSLHPDALVIRTSAFFGPWDEWNFAILALRSIVTGVPFVAAGDCVVSPTYVPDLVNASLDLMIDGERGIRHLANPGAMSWVDFARAIARKAGLSPDLVQSTTSRELGLTAKRPCYSVLGTEKGSILPPLDDALDRWSGSVAVRQLTSSLVLQQ